MKFFRDGNFCYDFYPKKFHPIIFFWWLKFFFSIFIIILRFIVLCICVRYTMSEQIDSWISVINVTPCLYNIFYIAYEDTLWSQGWPNKIYRYMQWSTICYISYVYEICILLWCIHTYHIYEIIWIVRDWILLKNSKFPTRKTIQYSGGKTKYIETLKVVI